MQLACVSEREQGPVRLIESSAVAFFLALFAAAAVIIRILWLDEAASDRTQILVLVVGCGAFLAAFVTALVASWLASRWKSWIRSALASVVCAALFVPSVMFSFAVENRLIEGHLEPGTIEEGRITELVFSMLGAMGLFTPTGMRYLVPWTLLAFFLCCLIVFYRWPRQSSR